MDHLDEHTLELYVLGDPAVQADAGRIETHLALCHGCGDLAARIRTYYGAVEEEMRKEVPDAGRAEQALVRSRAGLERWEEQFDLPVRRRPVTVGRRLRDFTRVHPVATAGGALAMVAAAALIIDVFVSALGVRENPVNVSFNAHRGIVSILGSRGTVLWEKYTSLTTGGSGWLSANRSSFAFLDLSGDAVNEVITTVPFDMVEEERSGDLFVYDSRGTLVHRVSLNRQVRYLDRHYARQFYGGPIVAGDVTRTGKREIFVEAANVRSPSYLLRLDLRLEETGSYWHFGHLGYVRTLDVNGDGKSELIIGGVNDSRDTVRGEFPVVVVLDPARIRGVRRSTASPGLDLPPSDAELYYIALPYSDLDSAFGRQPNVYHIADGKDGTIDVTMRTPSGLEEEFTLDYILNSRMEVIAVKSNNTTDRVHDRLRARGKVRRKLDSGYLEALRRSVRYWDGRAWRTTATMVNGTPAL